MCQNRKKRRGEVTVESDKVDKKKTKEDAEFLNKFTVNSTAANIYTMSASDDDVEDHGLPKGDLEEHRDRLIDFLNLVDKARIPKVCVRLCRYVRQLLGSIL